MPVTEDVRPTVTREMRLVSRLIEQDRKSGARSLAEFIAVRRHPDAGPLSWPQISYELVAVIGERVSEGTVRKWAHALGIPDPGPRIKLTADEYTEGLAAAGISLP